MTDIDALMMIRVGCCGRSFDDAGRKDSDYYPNTSSKLLYVLLLLISRNCVWCLLHEDQPGQLDITRCNLP